MALHLYDVIIRPVISEGSTIKASEENQFTFEVHQKANKIQIKEAIELIFNVDVLQVTTMILPAKRGQRGRKVYTRTAQWKKAIVTLPKGQTIPLFNA